MGTEKVQNQEIIGDRYLCKAPHIFLDTKPGLAPMAPAGDLPPEVDAYLRLFPYQLQVPQVYDLVSSNQGSLLLLEGAVGAARGEAAASQSLPTEAYLLPSLNESWSFAPAGRQLHWLWQLAHLWQPLSIEQVGSTLLTPHLLRIEGGIVRLLQLSADAMQPEISLMDLGYLWAGWVPTAQPEIQAFLENLTRQLMEGQIQTAEVLIQQLDVPLVQLGGQQVRQLRYTTRTDQGPSRQRNEDACYPAEPQVYTQRFGDRPSPPSPPPFVIVCDGIGGHQGGDVASQLAIDTVQRHLRGLQVEQLTPQALMQELQAALCIANDLISQRNDSEHRQDRQRMGTTIVLALMRNHELYLAHVGDSRAYWITRQGCHQITLDDDLASREVRLGYSFYREAVQNPTGGSLVQALGMSASSLLHPTVRRFILDEDSVFLLCSDGLSDNDRVEQYWVSEILPILEGRVDVGGVGDRLVQLANSLNGHDNVTVGLLHCQVAPSPSGGAALAGQLLSNPLPPEPVMTTVVAPGRGSDRPTGESRTPWLWGIAAALMLGGSGLAYFLFNYRVPALFSPTPTPTPAAPMFPLNALIQIGNSGAAPLPLLELPVAAAAAASKGMLSPGSIVQVVGEQRGREEASAAAAREEGDRWLKLKICSIGPITLPSPTPREAEVDLSLPPPSPFTPQPFITGLQPGEEGWVRESDLRPLGRLLVNASLTPEQGAVCPALPAVPLPPASSPGGAVGQSSDRTQRLTLSTPS